MEQAGAAAAAAATVAAAAAAEEEEEGEEKEEEEEERRLTEPLKRSLERKGGWGGGELRGNKDAVDCVTSGGIVSRVRVIRVLARARAQGAGG